MRLRPRGGRDGGVKYKKRGGSGTEEDDRDSKPAGKKRVVVKPPDKFLEEKWTTEEVEEAECESSGTLDSFIADDDEVEEGNEGLPMPALLSSGDGESSESSGGEGGGGIPEGDTDTGGGNARQRGGGAKAHLSEGRQTESTKIDNRGSMKRRRRSVVDDDPEEGEGDGSQHLMNRSRTGPETEAVAPPRTQGRLRREGSEVKAVRAAVGRRGCMVEAMSMAERVEEHRKRVMHGEEGEEEEEEEEEKLEDCDAAGRAEGSQSNSEEGLEDDLGEEEEDAFVVPDAEGRTYGYGDGGSDEERDGEEGEEEDERHPAGLRASRDDFRVYLVYVMKCILHPGFDQVGLRSWQR